MIKIKKGNLKLAPMKREVDETSSVDELKIVETVEPPESAGIVEPSASYGLAAVRKKAGMIHRALKPLRREETPEADPDAGCAINEDRPLIGWHSPSYTRSRSVELDRELLAKNRCVAHGTDAPEVDAYRILRTKILQRTQNSGCNTIMVTSAIPSEGKTLTAINLAFTFAQEFRQTVLLVDCDLKNQNIHKYLGYESDRGIIDYLLNDRPISELITWPGIEKLTVISGGRGINSSSELLGSQRMETLVDDMRARYPDRYVIFDVPPILSGADTIAFAPFVDNIIVTVQEGRTSIEDVNKALSMVPAQKVLGLVLNRQKKERLHPRKSA